MEEAQIDYVSILKKKRDENKKEYWNIFQPIADIIPPAVKEIWSWSEHIPDPIKQGSKVVGSGVMDVINVVDKLRGAAAGTWDVMGQYGPRIERDERTGEYSADSLFSDWTAYKGSVTDEKDFIDRVLEGAAEGVANPSTKSFWDEFGSLIPEGAKEYAPGGVPVGASGEFVGDVAANIAGDPLTYTPAAVVTVPFKIISGAAKKIGAPIGRMGPVKSVLEALNIYTGDAAIAKKLVNDVRLEHQGIRTMGDREGEVLNAQLTEIAKQAGVSVPELKSAIVEGIESGTIPNLGMYSQDVINFAEGEVDFYKKLLAREKAGGVPTEDIAARAGELGIVKEGYMPHVPGEEFFGKTLTQKMVNLLSPKVPSSQKRALEGTIKDINEKMGRSFFLDDPVTLHRLRKIWSDQALASNRLLSKAADEFGMVAKKDKDGVYRAKDGSRVPDDWEILKGVAYPSEIHRVLSRADKILSSPQEVHKLFKAFDATQNWWKKYALALRPAWHTRNAFGNFWNAYLIGGLTNPLRYGQAAAIQKAMHIGKGGSLQRKLDLISGKKPTTGVNPKLEVPGTGMTREEIFNEAVKRGVYESGLYGQDIAQSSLRQSNIPGATEWVGVNKAFEAGKMVENNARLALFIDGIAKGIRKAGGKGPIDATKILDESAINVRKSLFDYSDLSTAEKDYMKRAMPFYTWTRKNLPAQLRAIAEHPDRANKLNILIAGLQRDTKTIDSNDVDQWVKDQFPIFLNAKDSEDTHTFITAMSYLPTAELERIFTSPERMAHLFGQMGTPLLKVPAEIWKNYSVFKEKPIDVLEYKSEGKFGEGTFKSVPGLTGSDDFLGLKVTPKQKHLLQSLVLLGEIDRLNPFGVFGTEEKKSWAGATRHGRDILESSRWIRALTGARLYTREKGKAEMKKDLELRSDVEWLRRNIKYAARINEDLMEHLQRQLDEIMQ